MGAPSSTDSAATRVELDLAQWREVFARLDTLLDLPPVERQRATVPSRNGDGGAGDDADVLAVLNDLRQRTTLIDAPDAASIAAISGALLGGDALSAGTRCGSYRLIEPIGQGGMGSVWRAERMDGLYQSQVAVKLLGSLALSAHARARFAREGELLARLTHPHIAHLLDAGLTDDHQRFLVLEWVQGQDLVAYVAAKSLDQRATLVLFRQLLAAVAFAHSQLVVHRDIKPSNVMVTASGQLKLLDFGVAKLLDSDGAEDNLTRVVGAAYTEAYAAPEQLRGEATGTAADVFSLGCLLHQLLTDTQPRWSARKRELVEGMQPINDGGTWTRAPDDLRAIVLKALAVSPDERYATVAAFDDDVTRFLAGETVRAQPATRLYRWRKFVLRNRWPVLAGAAASAAVMASLGVALWQLQQARAQRSLALTEAARANAVNAYIIDLFDASDPRIASGQNRSQISAKNLLDAGARRLETSMDDQPETKLALLGTLAEIYAHADDRARSEQLLQQRIALAQLRFGPTHPSIHDSKITSLWSLVFAGEHQRAREQLNALETSVAAHPVAIDDNPRRKANRLHLRARIERWAAIEPIPRVVERYEEALFEYTRAEGNRASEDHAATLANYALALHAAKQSDSALAALDRAIAMFEQLPKRQLKDSGNLANTYSLRAQLAGNLGKKEEALTSFDAALELYKKSYGAAHPMALNVRLYRAKTLHQMDRRDEAWPEIDAVSALYASGTVDATVRFEPQYVRGQLLLAEGRSAEAIAALTQAADGWRIAQSNPRRLKDIEQLIDKARVGAK
jgi:eukaryotic-like serine/threonine-protein kinase